MGIAENLSRIRERIASAAAASGRHPNDITLVGVTKYVSAADAAELVTAGCTHLGESRPQELWTKAQILSSSRAESKLPMAVSLPVHWHLIGHLQRNKIRRTLPLVTLIHSVDSERLLKEINQACELSDLLPKCVDVLVEVNTSGESAKHGLMPDDVARLLDTAQLYPHVFVMGLMTMAALEGGESVAARNFASLRQLRDRLEKSIPPNVQLNELSMGMSGDFEVAIREGATIVRVGSLLWV